MHQRERNSFASPQGVEGGKMNWRRGLLRFWLLATGLWIGAILVLVRPDQDRMFPWHPKLTEELSKRVREHAKEISDFILDRAKEKKTG
jgi:hypothetical protein